VRCDSLVKGTDLKLRHYPPCRPRGRGQEGGRQDGGRRPAAGRSKADKAKGKLQNAVGGLKNAIRKV
jgi:hypothetical protein